MEPAETTKRRRLAKRYPAANGNNGVATVNASTSSGGGVGAPCTHEVVLKDLCAICGKRLHSNEESYGAESSMMSRMNEEGNRKRGTARVSMLHHVPELRVSSEHAQQIGEADRAHLLRARKLVLLVDLDQTLIHTTNRPPRPEEEAPEEIVGYRLGSAHYFTKLRPHVREFLERMHLLYELHVVSFGERQYAHKIAELLDPAHTLFNHRVLSRNELLSAVHKTHNLKSLFPCGEEMLVIVDDRADVWQFSESLIRVKPYRYFAEVGDINAIAAVANPPEDPQSASAEAEDPAVSAYSPSESTSLLIADQDDALERLTELLSRIHSDFYAAYDSLGGDSQSAVPDSKKVIAAVRREVLQGEHIVLSGIIPVGFKSSTEAAGEHPFPRICRQFGACIDEQVSEETTIVVAARLRTEKTWQAQQRGLPIVSPRWAEECWERWERVDPSRYALVKPIPKGEQRRKSTPSGEEGDPLPSPSGEEDELVPAAPRSRTCTMEFDALSKDAIILGDDALNAMDHEVEEALSDEEDERENDEESDNSDDEELDEMVANIERQLKDRKMDGVP